jgi:hypothetical protein
MKEKELHELKTLILEACKNKIQERMDEALAAMDRAADAALSEEKSSAGDKYETGRAMGYLERERYAGVLQQARKELQFYQQLKPVKDPQRVEPGVLVVADNMFILLATGIGKMDIAGHSLLVVSSVSPLGQKLRGLQAGAEFILNERSIRILSLV